MSAHLGLLVGQERLRLAYKSLRFVEGLTKASAVELGRFMTTRKADAS